MHIVADWRNCLSPPCGHQKGATSLGSSQLLAVTMPKRPDNWRALIFREFWSISQKLFSAKNSRGPRSCIFTIRPWFLLETICIYSQKKMRHSQPSRLLTPPRQPFGCPHMVVIHTGVHMYDLVPIEHIHHWPEQRKNKS